MSFQDWYFELSAFLSALGQPFHQLADRVDIPIVVALLLGLAGATAPCQVSTNIGAFGYVARFAGDSRMTMQKTLAFVGGKMAVYTLLGGSIILIGTEAGDFSQELIPMIQVIRQAMGPIFILSGLFMLGVFTFRTTVGERLKDRLLQVVPKKGAWGAFSLGVVFSLAFCPTLFLLFFGMVVPLGIRSTGGVVFPAVFALGTALPLFVLAYVLSVGGDAWRKKYVRQAGKVSRRLTKVIGAVFLLLGINDTILYWFV